MKQYLTILALTLASATAFAGNYGSAITSANDVKDVVQPVLTLGPVIVNGSVGATTNLIESGRTLSDKNPTVYANAGAQLVTPIGTVGAEYGIAKVNLGSSGTANLRQDLFITYHTSVKDVDFIAKFGERHYGSLGQRDGLTQNIILGVGYKGLFAAVDKTVVASGTAFYDTRAKVGYTLPLSSKLAVTAAGNFANYNQSKALRFDYVELSADYKLTKSVTVGGIVTKGGHTADGASIPSQFGVNVNYAF